MNEVEIVAKIWPSIRALGALGGLASASFLMWDRATRHLPYARFLRLDGSNIPEENGVILRIYNQSNRLMLARVVESKGIKSLYLSPDDETFWRSGMEGVIAINPNGYVDMNAERQDGWKTIPSDGPVCAIYEWKYAQPFIRRGWRRKRTVILKQDFDAVSTRPW